MPRIFPTILVLASTFLAVPAAAQDTELPYWASIAAEEVNMRTGPSDRYPITWTYRRDGLPVKVIRYHQGWRFVEEQDGTRGWMYAALLSQRRMAVVIGEGLATMRAGQSETSELYWNLEPGVVGELGECAEGWCAFDVEGRRGWVLAERLWGDGEP